MYAEVIQIALDLVQFQTDSFLAEMLQAFFFLIGRNIDPLIAFLFFYDLGDIRNILPVVTVLRQCGINAEQL